MAQVLYRQARPPICSLQPLRSLNSESRIVLLDDRHAVETPVIVKRLPVNRVQVLGQRIQREKLTSVTSSLSAESVPTMREPEMRP